MRMTKLTGWACRRSPAAHHCRQSPPSPAAKGGAQLKGSSAGFIWARTCCLRSLFRKKIQGQQPGGGRARPLSSMPHKTCYDPYRFCLARLPNNLPCLATCLWVVDILAQQRQRAVVVGLRGEGALPDPASSRGTMSFHIVGAGAGSVEAQAAVPPAHDPRMPHPKIASCPFVTPEKHRKQGAVAAGCMPSPRPTPAPALAPVLFPQLTTPILQHQHSPLQDPSPAVHAVAGTDAQKVV